MEKGGLRKPYTIKDDYAKHECNQQGKNDPAIVIEDINLNGHKSSEILRQNQQIRFGDILSPIVWIIRIIIVLYTLKNLLLKSHMHLTQYVDQVCIICGSVKVILCPLTSSVDRVHTCTTPSTHISVDLVIVL